MKGYLTYFPSTRKVEIKLDERKNKISNRFSNGRRGLELSELVTFNGKLLACDDKTGIIYHLIEEPEDTANASLRLNQTNTQLSENHPFKLGKVHSNQLLLVYKLDLYKFILSSTY